jgi:hypothetical protein
MTNRMKLGLLAGIALGLAAQSASAAPNPPPTAWEQPAASLADQIVAILGAGQAHLTIRNLSTMANDEIPVIRRLLVQDLKAHGVTTAGTDSANLVRVTLSETTHERLLVAEIVEGNQTQVAMVDLGPVQPQVAPATGGLTLLSQQILTSQDPVLAVAELSAGLIALEPSQLVLYASASSGWQQQRHVTIEQRRQLDRDPRGVLTIATNDQSFEAWLPGTRCNVGTSTANSAGDWTAQCHDSDDPWPIAQVAATQQSSASEAPADAASPPLSAFYNASRDYFTGVITPSIGVDLPPFYSAALIPRAAGSGALLIGGIDGKVQLAENGTLKAVAGTRDWGSDFAALHSGCGAGTQVIASGSGEAVTDSLRAYELPALEATPFSAPLAMDGTVMSLWTAPDGKSVLAVVRNAGNRYEVDRVTALCN